MHAYIHAHMSSHCITLPLYTYQYYAPLPPTWVMLKMANLTVGAFIIAHAYGVQSNAPLFPYIAQEEGNGA